VLYEFEVFGLRSSANSTSGDVVLGVEEFLVILIIITLSPLDVHVPEVSGGIIHLDVASFNVTSGNSSRREVHQTRSRLFRVNSQTEVILRELPETVSFPFSGCQLRVDDRWEVSARVVYDLVISRTAGDGRVHAVYHHQFEDGLAHHTSRDVVH